MKGYILCALALPLAAACAAPGASTEEIQTNAQYRTGSNIPVRDRGSDGVVVVDKSTIQDQMVKKTTGAPGGGGGG